MTDGEAPGDARQQASGDPLPANKIILYSQAYIAVMEEASAALPGETIGLLLGSDQVAPTGDLWITIKDIESVSLTSTTTDLLPSDLQSLMERARKVHSGPNVVGWFYADPALSATSPRIPPDRWQHYLHPSAALFLLVNPIVGQGAFYWWDGTHYEPSGQFYEAVPDETSSPVVAWDGEVEGAAQWLGSLLAPTHLLDSSSATQDDTQPAPPLPEEDVVAASVIWAPTSSEERESTTFSPPMYVEVITEEPVEYVAPDTGTKPHPVVIDPPQSVPTEPDPPSTPRQVPTTGPLSSRTDKLGPTPGERGLSSYQSDPPSSAQTGPLDPQPLSNGPTTGKLADIDHPETPDLIANTSTPTAPLRALVPVAHSPVRPVMRRRDWREVLLTVAGLLAIALILISLFTGLPAQQEQNPSIGSPAVTPPPTTQDIRVPAAIPSVTLTLTPSIDSLPPR